MVWGFFFLYILFGEHEKLAIMKLYIAYVYKVMIFVDSERNVKICRPIYLEWITGIDFSMKYVQINQFFACIYMSIRCKSQG